MAESSKAANDSKRAVLPTMIMIYVYIHSYTYECFWKKRRNYNNGVNLIIIDISRDFF
jgi:hypothetical protein